MSGRGVSWVVLSVGVVGNWDVYLTAQHACLEALPILPTLCSEERANACVKVTEGFIFVC